MTPGRHFSALSAYLLLISALGAAACGGRSGATQPATGPLATSEEPPSTEDPTEPVTEPTSAAPASDASSAAEDPKSSAPTATPLELCNKMCDRVATACTKNAATACRTNCQQYEHPPAGCDTQVSAALECAAKAPDVTCTIIAPESCAPEFRRVVACTTGKEDPGRPQAVEAKLPDGWERFEARSHGFAVAMPRGVSEKSGAKEPTYEVQQGQVTYAVRILPSPKDKPTQKNLVPFTTKVLGGCARKLKLFGLIERPERTSIRYESRCADGAEWRGSLVFAANRLYMLQITSPGGVKVDADAFVYSFELL